jgi:hypothetical protein
MAVNAARQWLSLLCRWAVSGSNNAFGLLTWFLLTNALILVGLGHGQQAELRLAGGGGGQYERHSGPN